MNVAAVPILLAASLNPGDWEDRLKLTCLDSFDAPWVSIEAPSGAKRILAESFLAPEDLGAVSWYRHTATLAACVHRPPTPNERCNSIKIVRISGEGNERVMQEEPWVFCPPPERP
jgi:hypothetical protein